MNTYDSGPRCGAVEPVNKWRCVRDPDHEGLHGYAGCYWANEPTVKPDRDELARTIYAHEAVYADPDGNLRCSECDAVVTDGNSDGDMWHDSAAHQADAVMTLLAGQSTVAEVRAQALNDAADEWEALVRREKPPIRGSLFLRRLAARERGDQ